MPTTPKYLLPYPAATDQGDVSADVQRLAVRLDTAIGNTFFRRSVAPSNAGNIALSMNVDMVQSVGGPAYEISFTPDRDCVYHIVALSNFFTTLAARTEAQLDPYVVSPAGVTLSSVLGVTDGASVWLPLAAFAWFNAVSGQAYVIRMHSTWLGGTGFSYATNPAFTSLTGWTVT